jgi:DNA-binding NarL/FixJ family response regulator
MQRKTVVIVEDSEPQRIALQTALERRNFRVGGAATAAEARALIERFRDEIDVMVLDMRLEDPSEPEKTGSDIGIELQQETSNSPPEYLIHSAFAEVNYYKLALRLGAAAYLSKNETSLSDVIRHVRALALKRALRLGRPKMDDSLRAISSSTKSLPAAVAKFCQEILANELEACLGIPYVLLLTDESGTQNCASNVRLPIGHYELYGALQALAQGISNSLSPIQISEQNQLPQPRSPAETKVYDSLKQSVLIALGDIHGFQLSLALLKPPAGATNDFEDSSKLATVIAQYVRSAFIEHFVRILTHLDSQKREMMLRSTARLCLSLGEDQQGMIEQGITSGQLQEGSQTHSKLITMATDLWETGTILESVSINAPLHGQHEVFEMNTLVEKAFHDLEEKMSLDGFRFEVHGRTTVEARKDDIYVAVIRILQWLVQRRSETTSNVEQAIMVRCLNRSDRSETIFEDRSFRLPRKLREQLFLPFSASIDALTPGKLSGPGVYLPLYLAKILVEEKYGGTLEDKSDELDGGIGHKLVIAFSSRVETIA